MEKVKPLRFDETAIEEAQEMAKALLEHPEIGSVAIVIGWELPGQAASGLTSGVWIPKDNQMSFQRVRAMQEQLLKLQGMTLTATDRIMDSAASDAKEDVDKTSPEA